MRTKIMKYIYFEVCSDRRDGKGNHQEGGNENAGSDNNNARSSRVLVGCDSEGGGEPRGRGRAVRAVYPQDGKETHVLQVTV